MIVSCRDKKRKEKKKNLINSKLEHEHRLWDWGSSGLFLLSGLQCNSKSVHRQKQGNWANLAENANNESGNLDSGMCVSASAQGTERIGH